MSLFKRQPGKYGCPVVTEFQRKGDSSGRYTIEFDHNKAEIKPEYLDILSEITHFLIETPDAYLVLGGHTDSEGGELYNYKLGFERADATRQYLVRLGIAWNRIQVLTFGEAVPIRNNNNQNEMARKPKS